MAITNIGNLDAGKSGNKGVSQIDPASLPGFFPSAKTGGVDASKMRVRYLKLDMDQLGDITELEKLETKAIRDQGIYILSKERFVFMDRILMLVQFLERIEDN